MEDDEFVETSDPEEREELCRSRSPYRGIYRQPATYLPGDDHSRRKRIKLHHTFSVPSTPVRSPSILNISLDPSASSPSRRLDTFSSSTPKSSSFAQTPEHAHVMFSENVWIDDTDNLSQDPLMLLTHSDMKHQGLDTTLDVPSSPPPPSCTDDQLTLGEDTRFCGAPSPSPSSPSSKRSRSPDPLSLFDVPSPKPSHSPVAGSPYCSGTPPRSPCRTQHPSESPIRWSISPLTPTSSPQQHLVTSLDKSPPEDAIPGPRAGQETEQLPSEQNEESNDQVLHNTDLHDIPAISRYPLRKRALAQIKPYTVEKIQYKQALRANPDAIVHYRDPGRATNEHYDHTDNHIEESQAPWAPDDDADGYESDGGRRRNRETAIPRAGSGTANDGIPEQPAQYPEILQDLPSTDDEEARDFRKTSKEARRLARERKAKEDRERKEKIENRHKPKAFPLKETKNSSSTEETRRLRSLSLPSDVLPSRSLPSRSPCHINTPARTSPVVFSPTSSPLNELDVARSYSRSPTQSSDVVRHDETESPVEHNILSDAQLETLGRMYPKFMLPALLGDGRPRTAQTKQATSERSASEDKENDVLLPGQTRVRLSRNPGAIKDVKGDTESSDEERGSVTDSDLDIPSTRPPAEPSFEYWESDGTDRDVLVLTDSSAEDSDDGVDDKQIQAYLEDDIGSIRTTSGGYQREENLIDYMLARTRIVHHDSRSRSRRRLSGDAARKRDAKLSKPRISVTIKGGQHMRQTRLNFGHHTGANRSGCKGGGSHSSSPFRRATSDVEDHLPDDARDRVDPEFDPAKKRKSRKQMERERRAHAKGNGLYTFTSDHTRIVTGRKERGMVIVDIEDEGFRRRAPPSSYDWALPFQPAYTTDIAHNKAASKKPSASTDHRVDHDVVQTGVPDSRARALSVDFNIPVLCSGISFGADTYIGKGWLSELVSVIRGEMPPPMPATVALCGIELGPATSIDDFGTSLGRIFDAVFDMIASFWIEAANEKQEWRRIQRVANQLLSWLLAHATETDAEIMRENVRERTSKFVSRIRDLSLEASSIDSFVLSGSWFAVELSARLWPSSLSRGSCTTDQSVSLLVHLLLAYGFERAMDPVLGGRSLDGSITAHDAAELWVSLFHLADHQRDHSESSKQVHPFLSAVMKALEPPWTFAKSALEASETIWRSIFSLCALTQFSLHGMTTSKSRLPACWDFVVLALKSIRLLADDKTDSTIPLVSLRKRDKYIGLVTNRCFHLWSVWNWKLENPSDLFSQLSDIFRSRKFAGLRHEPAEYPSFFKQNDWGSLSRHDRQDTAFTVFLKLLVQAAGCDGVNPNRTLAPKAKKLLSLAIPVGALPFSKKTPLIVQDLTMLHNRFSALAVAIYLDPTHHSSRISHARKYDDFADANETTRIAVIRGMMYFAIMLKTARLSMEGIKGWIESMATVLVNDFRGLQTSEPLATSQAERKIKRDRVVFCLHLLVGSVRTIISAYAAKCEYPDPMFLSSLEPVFRGPQALIDSPRIAEVIRELVQTFLDARKSALPPPQRPRIVPQAAQESQESQDEYYTVDMDYDDPALLAILDGGVQMPNFKEKEAAVKSSIDGRFVWWAWRNLNKWVPEPAAPANDDFSRIDRWLDCWLGCADILIRADGKTWSQFLHLRKSWHISDRRRRRMDLAVMMRVLKLDPMTYLEYQDNYLENLMVALVSPDPTFEREFIALLLSIDGSQHHLLAGLSLDATDDIMDESHEEREPKAMIHVILRNLAGQLQQRAMGDASAELDCEKYVGFCIKMLQAMKDNLSDLMAGSEARQKYLGWCRSIVQIVHEQRGLRVHPRLTFWMAWARELS
ncbi:hypothetical protein LshimejAT787_1005540 [Lyophyllum shimeji]|uniref:Uncharacterized protein n=1 Tax=Lyophyllum shimeji TaxID=47721 RepID=A0A9P3PUW0_LYOSH|nr:hypothetical protein LshimejAT787_1005540 [Lyophyllum shimeji]